MGSGVVTTVTTLGNPFPPEPELEPQRGDMPKFFSAERGWSRSGERARLRRGEPGSADLGLCPD